jgi:putative membrane protein
MSLSPGPHSTPDSAMPAGWVACGWRSEFALLRRPMVILALVAITCVPALYAILYITSVWDPYGRLDRLPAALFDADRGAVRAGREVRLGEATVQFLVKSHPFAFTQYSSEEAARAAVRDGSVYFAVIFPPDFSSRALSARESNPASFVLLVSEGNNYTSSVVSIRFGSELAHVLNERLNAERWALIVGAGAASASPSATTLREGLDQLRDGANRLHSGAVEADRGGAQLKVGLESASEGAHRLAAGTEQFAGASAQMADGFGQVGDGVLQIRRQLPTRAQLEELAAGSRSLVAGSGELAVGLDRLTAGAGQLDQGARQLQAGSRRIPLVGGRLSAGAGQIEAGIVKLDDGLVQATDGGRRLHDGLEKLDGGVQPLAQGVARLGDGLKTMGERLPDAAQLQQFRQGAQQLREGSSKLASGIDSIREGEARLAEGNGRLDEGTERLAAGLGRMSLEFESGFSGTDAAGLAVSVREVVQKFAPVSGNGMAYTPYFAALSLWIGGVMMSFVLYFRRLCDSAQGAPRLALWLIKAPLLLAIGAAQATFTVWILQSAVGVAFAHPWLVWCAAVLGSVSFVTLILMLVSILGDAGRLLAVVLLILQLASAGGIYPVELSAPFFQAIHPYLPFTLLVRIFRATMFDAFGGAWSQPALRLAATALGGALVTVMMARWKYVAKCHYTAAVDV